MAGMKTKRKIRLSRSDMIRYRTAKLILQNYSSYYGQTPRNATEAVEAVWAEHVVSALQLKGERRALVFERFPHKE